MKRTSEKDEEFSHKVGMKTAAYWRRKYPRHTAKMLADEFGVAVVTAKGWLAGRCPATEHLLRMLARQGAVFFAFVFADVDEDLAAIARHKAEVEAIEKRIQGLHEAVKGNGIQRD